MIQFCTCTLNAFLDVWLPAAWRNEIILYNPISDSTSGALVSDFIQVARGVDAQNTICLVIEANWKTIHRSAVKETWARARIHSISRGVTSTDGLCHDLFLASWAVSFWFPVQQRVRRTILHACPVSLKSEITTNLFWKTGTQFSLFRTWFSKALSVCNSLCML